MPMFEVGAGRSVALHPVAPTTGSLDGQTPSLVAEHLDSLLGEHLLPLRISEGGSDEPYLLAVDAAGQPVVVEVVAMLDESTLLRALAFAGQASQLSTQDLAHAYRGGADHYLSHLATFRSTVRATALLPTGTATGARLLIVCSRVADGLEDVIDFLLQPGWPVHVLTVGVVEGADGRRLVDVSPLPRRVTGPTTLPAPATADSPPAAGPVGSVAPEPADSTPSASADSVSPASADSVSPAPAAMPAPVPVVELRSPGSSRTPAREMQGLPGRPDDTRPVPTVVAPPFAVRRSTVPGMPPSEQAPEQPSEPLPYAFTGVEPPTTVDRRLTVVADHLDVPAPLVWNRQRRGERYEALLHQDGTIELPDGSRCLDPDQAAAVVSASSAPVDGWAVWRVDSASGPTLAEVADRL
jgi:hypothetical protein